MPGERQAAVDYRHPVGSAISWMLILTFAVAFDIVASRQLPIDKLQLFNSDGTLQQSVDTSSDPFIFETTELPSNLRYLPSVGNGHLATNVYTSSIFINGLYNGETGWSHRAHVPSFHASNLTFSRVECQSDQHRTYRLNLKHGFYEEVLQSGDDVTVTYRTYAHQFYSRLLVTEVHIDRTSPRCLNDSSTCCDLADDFDVERTNLNLAPAEDDFYWDPEANYTDPDFCQSASCHFLSGTVIVPETPDTRKNTVHIYRTEMPDIFVVPSGIATAHWTFIEAVDMEKSDYAKADFDKALEFLKNNRQADLLKNHTDAFNDIWVHGDIEVDGDLHLQKVLRGCLYYLYTSLPSHPTNSPSNQFYGLSPGGLPNGANHTDYQGHVFWDMETWMYPPILMLRPDLGRDMLSYRIHGIRPALTRAAEGGYAGARFPWESAQTGVEVTPVICIPCRENQQHITGDIAFAARQYVSATHDTEWLLTPQAGTGFSGFEFIRQMAQFWSIRPRFNQTRDRFEINGVMPPDEHAENVNNSIYTNIMASYAIHFAHYAACLAGKNSDDEVPNSWMRVAQRLAFPFNYDKRYHEEFDGYDFLLETGESDTRGVKQADVVMLGFPLLWSMPDDVRTNDLLHYENVTNPNGPAMTWGIFATGWLDLGNFDNADRLFNKTYQSYSREPFKVWTEVQSGDGAINFITGMGGFLQTVIFGYSGLRLNVDNLHFHRARLPPGGSITRLALRGINYLNTEFDVQIYSNDTIRLTVTTAGGTSLQLNTTEGTLNFGEGFDRIFTSQELTMFASTPTNCPSIQKPEIDVDYQNPATTSNTCIYLPGREQMWIPLVVAILLELMNFRFFR